MENLLNIETESHNDKEIVHLAPMSESKGIGLAGLELDSISAASVELAELGVF